MKLRTSWMLKNSACQCVKSSDCATWRTGGGHVRPGSKRRERFSSGKKNDIKVGHTFSRNIISESPRPGSKRRERFSSGKKNDTKVGHTFSRNIISESPHLFRIFRAGTRLVKRAEWYCIVAYCIVVY